MFETNLRYTPTTPTANVFFPNIPKVEADVFQRTLHHRAVISYSVPRERVRALVPEEFDLPENVTLSIEMFLENGRVSCEQTNFRVQVLRNGQPYSWLLGITLGSLSGVSARQLYPTPWHLSAMEFQVSFDVNKNQYDHYRLSGQSQWANYDWEIQDTGVAVLSTNPQTITDYFVRRDGEIGSYETTYRTTATTRGKLKAGRCDMLEQLGILSQSELQNPTSIDLQRTVRCEIKPAVRYANILLAA